MSRKTSNVNPDHYKLAGRNRQGENIEPELEKQKYTGGGQATRRKRRRKN
jgi:hypothetical protein